MCRVILVLHCFLLAWISYVHSPVVNEPNHLAAGLSHLCLGSFGLFRVNPPLVRTVVAVPVVLLSPRLDWNRYNGNPLVRSEYDVGKDFIQANGDRSWWLLRIARWCGISFSVLGGYICYSWGKKAYGVSAGTLALLLWCSCPYVLGHASLITPDAHAAAMGVAAGYAFWLWLSEPHWDRAVFAGIVLGLAELTKFTLLVFYPLWLVMWVLYRLSERRQMYGSQWWRQAGQFSLVITLSVLLINAGYSFEGSFQRLADYQFQSRTMTGIESLDSVPRCGGNRFTDTWLGTLLVPLPRIPSRH